MNCINLSCPYTLAIRQIYCQNGVPRTIENVYTNIQPNTQVSLEFGYTLTYVDGDNKTATILLENSLFIPSITFKIPNGSFKVFYLEVPNGTLKVYVGARIYSGN